MLPVHVEVAFGLCLAMLFALAGAMTYCAKKVRAHIKPEWRSALRDMEGSGVDRLLWGALPKREWLTEAGARYTGFVDSMLVAMLIAVVGVFLVSALATHKLDRWMKCETVFQSGCVALAPKD